VEYGEDLEQEIWVGALKAVPNWLQDREHNVQAKQKILHLQYIKYRGDIFRIQARRVSIQRNRG
jgi:hypothetical protein